MMLEMMAYGHGHGVRSVISADLAFQLQDMPQHFPYLLLVGIAIARDGLLHFTWGIFSHRDTRLHGGSDRYTLCPSQFEHALYVLAEKRRFDGKIMRLELADQLADFFMDKP